MAAPKDFAHLHVHTDYSLLDGAAKIQKLVAEAKRLGQSAIAITDHGYLFGAYEFYKECKAQGVKPIIGIEAYMTPGTSRFGQDRVLWGTEEQRADDVSARGAYTHLTLLSYNNTGLHNLFRMGSQASLEGQMGKWPRMDMDLLEQYHEGMIATAGCPSGEVQTRLRLGQEKEALEAAGQMQDLFGKENYFVEIMDHNNQVERRVRNALLDLAKKIDAPLIATNDSHYVSKEDAEIQDAMLCINSGSTLQDPTRFKFDGEGYHLRSTQEMYDLFGDLPGAMENTLLIAERCEVSFQTAAEGANYMPVFPVPAGEDITSWFVKEVERGLHERYGEKIPADVRKRADYEVGVICEMGFPGYFLVVADYINWARDNGIRVGPGRGSGAGSMVAYALGITQLDPIKHGLLFERFLNPERVSMPDIDVDFDERRRGEVIEYVEEKYGHDKVSQVVTFGTIKTKQALKDASRVLGYPYEMGDRLTKALPPAVMGNDIKLSEVFDENAPRYNEAVEFRETVKGDPDAQRVFSLAQGIEGLTRQWGVHACAVLMSSVPLTDVIPLMKRPADGAVITQFEYPLCEELGILKMDFLGLSNLTTIDDALQNIVDNGKEPVVIEEVDFEDQTTMELLQRGETLGIFQLDGSGMRTLLRQMKPTGFDDISAVSALYRPGPMGMNSHTNYALRKNGMQKIEPIHPELDEPLHEILGPTYGLIVYQEQIMQIARKVAGFSMGQADSLRKAMGKKKKHEMDKMYVDFETGMKENGYSKEAVQALWGTMEPFASYAFNKSHSAAYGVISMWTAWLKAHYPVEYMAAVLTSRRDNRNKLSLYLGETRRMGIRVLVPDVNESQMNFSAVGEEIRFGLSAVKNVGIPIVEGIVQARKEKGRFESFQDFLDKVPIQVLNKRAIESLVKAGAFDSFGYSRRALLSRVDEAVDSVAALKKNEAVGQFDLFGGTSVQEGVEVTIPEIPEWDKREKLNKERDVLGLYVSDHPLSGMEHILDRAADTTIVRLMNEETIPDGASLSLAGLITKVETRISKKNGRMWATVVLEDLTGSAEINFFPNTYQQVSGNLQTDQVAIVRCRVSDRDGNLQLAAQEMTLPSHDLMPDSPVDLQLGERMCTSSLMDSLRQVLQNYPGSAPVRLHVRCPGKTVVVQVAQKFYVNPVSALFSDLRVLLGRNCIMS
ncbi:DNA polymerase-3 subunit alpha [Actinobaculum suis]|uniref:DNA polymerase III subunit alpha n=1 Tax=Actinobaculum suis TaxID=1657 RepID=A0A1G6ZB16_9ACTO|nr:DNA polymerase III subunit alpha [Actinobaculum suis]MDY5153868.1 DNA polymerase III subunit alpha [Actinobaculum suis]SDD99662.1 DNA polymerase-3 subunit alpha [Actinobaculum suis]